MGDIVDSLGAGINVAEGDAATLANALEALRDFSGADPDRRGRWLASRERSVLAGSLYGELDALIDSPARAG
jgi:hypothetical protein